jgi:RNA polymerase sigma-70 factor (ECF subfamily)
MGTKATARSPVSADPAVAISAAVASGEAERALELMVDAYGEDIYRYCRRMLGNEADGDDVSQTVFLQALEGIRGRDRLEHARPWLFTIARNRCLDRIRTRARQLHTSHDPEAAGAAVDGAARLEHQDAEALRALDECLDALDVRSRAVVVMRFYDQLAYDEIGGLTGDRSGALRVRVARALPALRNCLEIKGVTV